MIRLVVVLLIQLQLVNRVNIIGSENLLATVSAMSFHNVNATLFLETQLVIVVLIKLAQLVKSIMLIFVNVNANKSRFVIVD